jgi:hypothetical protein
MPELKLGPTHDLTTRRVLEPELKLGMEYQDSSYVRAPRNSFVVVRRG